MYVLIFLVQFNGLILSCGIRLTIILSLVLSESCGRELFARWDRAGEGRRWCCGKRGGDLILVRLGLAVGRPGAAAS